MEADAERRKASLELVTAQEAALWVGGLARACLCSKPACIISGQTDTCLEKYNSRFHPVSDQTGCPDGAGGQLGEEAQHTVVQLLGGGETSVLKDFAQGSNQKNLALKWFLGQQEGKGLR